MPKKDSSHFSDPIAVKKQASNNPTSKWAFNQTPYDERTSCFMNAGTHYGVGHRQPVGHEGNPKEMAPTLPEHRARTMRIDEAG